MTRGTPRIRPPAVGANAINTVLIIYQLNVQYGHPSNGTRVVGTEGREVNRVHPGTFPSHGNNPKTLFTSYLTGHLECRPRSHPAARTTVPHMRVAPGSAAPRKDVPSMSIVMRNRQMLALVILAVLTLLMLALTLLATIWHINVLHMFSAFSSHIIPMATWGSG